MTTTDSAPPKAIDEIHRVYHIEKTNGQRLLCMYERTHRDEPIGLVVMPPGYERRMHHYAVFAAYLARHGFDVLRFDLSNHLGFSDGEVVNFTLSSAADDIATAIAHANEISAGLPICVVGTSLAARAAIRAVLTVQDDSPSQALVMILPVVDVEHTTTEAIGRNVIDEWRRGLVTDPDLVGRVINQDVAWAFVQDAHKQNLAELESTCEELAELECDALALAAAEDSWVRVPDVERAFDQSGRYLREIVVLEAASHDLSTNAPVLRLLMEEIISWLWTRCEHAGASISHLDFQEVVALINQERSWKAEKYQPLIKGT
jgi:pimeloyl-ACP methyl ester carboxylesterase